MEKRRMGKRIYREPTAEQAAKYRRIRDMIASEIPEIKEEARAIRRGRNAKISEANRSNRTKRPFPVHLNRYRQSHFLLE